MQQRKFLDISEINILQALFEEPKLFSISDTLGQGFASEIELSRAVANLKHLGMIELLPDNQLQLTEYGTECGNVLGFSA